MATTWVPCPPRLGRLPSSCLRVRTRFLCWHRAAVPPPRHCPRDPKGLPGGKAGLSGAPQTLRVLLSSPRPMAGLRILCPSVTWNPQPFPLGWGWGGFRVGAGVPFSITLEPLGDESTWSWAAGVASPAWAPIQGCQCPPPPPAAWHHCDSAGMSVPLQGSESPPPPRKGAASPQDPQFCPKEGTQTQTLSWKRDARMPLLELVPAHPPHS